MRSWGRTGLWCVAAVVASSLVAPAVAHAGIEDRFGLGTRAMGLAGSLGARPGSFSAVWYDPAALAPRLGEGLDPPGFVQLDAGVVWGRPEVYVNDLGGADIGDRVAAPTPDTFGFWVGSRFDLGHALRLEGLSAGLSVYLPGKNVFRWSIHPDDQLQWMFLTDRTQHITIDAGLAYRIAPWLSVGMSVRILFDTQTLTTGEVVSQQRVVDPDTGAMTTEVVATLGEEVRVVGHVSPIVGVLAEPVDGLRLSLTFRARTFVDDYGWTRVEKAPILGTLGYAHRFVHYYQPLQLTAAVAGRPVPGLWLSLDVTWANWSEGLTVNAASPPGLYRDTWSVATGLTWDAGRGVHLLAGYRFDMAPFDNRGGPTNLLVNDAHVSALGLELHLDELTGQEGWRYTFGLSGQLHFLVERTEIKDRASFVSDEVYMDNPGQPGYRYGGVVPALSASAQAEW